MSNNYEEIKNYFRNIEDVIVTDGKGAQGIKFNKKMFCMFAKGDLMLQFPEDRVKSFISEGIGKEVSYAKDRVIISSEFRNDWIKLTLEALEIKRAQ